MVFRMELRSQKLTIPDKCRYFFGHSLLTLFSRGFATDFCLCSFCKKNTLKNSVFTKKTKLGINTEAVVPHTFHMKRGSPCLSTRQTRITCSDEWPWRN